MKLLKRGNGFRVAIPTNIVNALDWHDGDELNCYVDLETEEVCFMSLIKGCSP